MLAELRARRADRDAGFSLLELIVVTSIFGVIMAVITASVVQMMKQSTKESGTADNLDNARKVIQTLDRTARYANNINTPGIAADGNYYVEYRVGNTGQQQTCYQWRYMPSTHQVQYRTWLPPLAGVGAVTATSWTIVGNGIYQTGATAPWSITASNAANVHEQLAVVFSSKHGAPSTTTSNQVTITGINTASSSPLASICNEVGRP
ncbi:MAG: type II secretion system protein [Frankiaceae bacterium]|nr:type II secretion system protein [Frankiaceae bacterium]